MVLGLKGGRSTVRPRGRTQLLRVCIPSTVHLLLQASQLDPARLLVVLQVLSAALIGTPTPDPSSLPVRGRVLETDLLGKLGKSFGDCLLDRLFKLVDLPRKLFFWCRCSYHRGRRVSFVVASG